MLFDASNNITTWSKLSIFLALLIQFRNISNARVFYAPQFVWLVFGVSQKVGLLSITQSLMPFAELVALK
jgi:hypothetical protein